MSKPANKNFNTTVTGMYKLSNGGFWSMRLDAKAYDALQTARVGDRLLFKPVSEGLKETKGDKFPDGFFEIIPAEKLNTFPQSSKSETKTASRHTESSRGNRTVTTEASEGGTDDWG